MRQTALNTLALLFVILTVLNTAGDVAGSQEKRRLPRQELVARLTIADFLQITKMIEDCPEWSEQSPNSEQDWAQLARIAARLQALSEAEVIVILCLYMSQHNGEEMHSYLRSSAKPMLVLRMMFDIPADEIILPSEEPDAWEQLLERAGGLPGKTLLTERGRRLSSPILWVDGRPTLSAMPVFPAIGTFSSYQPHFEYQYLAGKYWYRKNLDKLYEESGPLRH